MTKKISSVIDTPKQANEKDAFGIEKYTNGLINFIENTATPITIALQGEWGSGKTSLMNTLRKELCDDEGKRFYPVWINTWQFSLMKNANQTLISIIKGLTEEVVALTKDKNSENIKKLSSVFGKVFKASAKVALKATTGQDIDEVIDAFAPENKEITVLQLRDALNSAMKDILNEGKDAFIFFIDDLDRIDPPVAVEILELLKNIFDLENCVFVLAIDYDVIIKGLEPKFGKFTEKNEREFRSFFDKIIQLPFSMPVANYNIDDFLIDNLDAIGYLDDKQKNNNDFKEAVSEITRFSVGSNPRALKRLLNSLSLINSINKGVNEGSHENDTNDNLDKLINFALVNIQIAYPQIYSLLVQYPNFVGWDNKIAIQLNLPKLDDDIIEKIHVQEEFDEDWEKVLFRVCEKDFFLKKKALNISRLLNKVRSIIENEKENTGEIISQIISLSSVTNLEAFDKPVVNYHKGSLLKGVRRNVVESLKKVFPDKNILHEGKRVQSNAYFSIDNFNKWRIWSWAHEDKIRMGFVAITPLGWSFQDFNKNLEQANLREQFESMRSEFVELIAKYSDFESEDLKYHTWQDFYYIHFYFNLTLPDTDSFYEKNIINAIVDIVANSHKMMEKTKEMCSIVETGTKENFENWKNK